MSDESLVDGIQLLAKHAGVFTETAGGVTMAGAKALAKVGRLRNNDEVVLYITGNGLKTTEAVTDRLEQRPAISATIGEVERIADELFASIA